ncbi:hypothetical protein NT239_14760 [Chitinibacter sp. SCUT-21]|uniref:hypothetical protein n=1 Tax=Chitinibacter sp. SCUT-21 TaxID=2970891 RepID=UPI0035A72C2F
MSKTTFTSLGVCLYWACLSHSWAADDLDALALADHTAQTSEQARPWQLFIEGMSGLVNYRNTQEDIYPQRISIDLGFDYQINPAWRAVLANRLDLNWQSGQDEQINTLKEAYLSWQAQPELIIDLGRVNQRNGMAYGYNPTDYFKVGAVRSLVSIEPSSLRENRLGSGMLRGQYLWDGGAISALYSPKLGDRRNTAAFDLDWGASNPSSRWQLALSQQWFNGFTPQFLLFGEEGQAPQIGANISFLVGDALTMHGEYSGGQARSLLDQALQNPSEAQFYSRLAAGGTYTFPIDLSLTLEYQYNQAAANHQQWQVLASQPQKYWAYRQYVFHLQDNPTQHNLFMLANWNNALWRRFDLSAMLRHDLVDHSGQYWLEARYRFSQADIALQWQYQQGNAGSQFGALPQKSSVQALLKYYF